MLNAIQEGLGCVRSLRSVITYHEVKEAAAFTNYKNYRSFYVQNDLRILVIIKDENIIPDIRVKNPLFRKNTSDAPMRFLFIAAYQQSSMKYLLAVSAIIGILYLREALKFIEYLRASDF